MQNYKIDTRSDNFAELQNDYERLVLPEKNNQIDALILNDVIQCMNFEEVTFFYVPRTHTIDQKNHLFCFKVDQDHLIYEGCQ